MQLLNKFSAHTLTLLILFLSCCVLVAFMAWSLNRPITVSGICNIDNGRVMATSCDKLVYCVENKVKCE